MKKNPVKSMVKSIVRAVWKIIFKPLVKAFPKSRLKQRLLRAGGRIERREWWPKPPKHNAADHSHPFNSFLMGELKALGAIEPALQPSKDFLNQLSQHSYQPSPNLEHNSYGEAYGLLMRHLKHLDFDVVFLAPWLKRGGADLGLLHHINAQHEKGMKILLVTTENVESPWLDRLPASAIHLNFSEFSEKLSPHKSAELLARLLLQTPAQTIHNINSALGWDVYKKYGLQLKSMDKKLFASVFCEDEYEPGLYFGYACYLPETFRFIESVFCDTRWYPDEQSQLTGLDGLMKTVYFPFLGNLKPYAAVGKSAPVLWASRIAKQKRPELLYQIAKAMPELEFHVYGESERACRKELEQLQTLKNVKYFGKYNSFSEIAGKQQYAAFLYTSQYDGLPNVLIEAISNGLPVISYDVGGIGELIHPDALLTDNDVFEENIIKIKNIISDKILLENTWQYSRELLRERHSWSSFIHVLESVNGYFPQVEQEVYKARCSEVRVLSRPESLMKIDGNATDSPILENAHQIQTDFHSAGN